MEKPTKHGTTKNFPEPEEVYETEIEDDRCGHDVWLEFHPEIYDEEKQNEND